MDPCPGSARLGAHAGDRSATVAPRFVGAVRQTPAMTDYSTYIAPVATVLAAGVGAYLSGRLGQRNAESDARRTRRQELADSAIAACHALRGALHKSDPRWTGREWERVLGDTYDSLNAAAPVLPRRLLHLRRSIRAACGEALGGVAVFELIEVREHMEPTDFDSQWTEYARDYVDLAMQALQHWREATERDAEKVGAPTYDEWLRNTGRYRPSP